MKSATLALVVLFAIPALAHGKKAQDAAKPTPVLDSAAQLELTKLFLDEAKLQNRYTPLSQQEQELAKQFNSDEAKIRELTKKALDAAGAADSDYVLDRDAVELKPAPKTPPAPAPAVTPAPSTAAPAAQGAK